MTSKSGRSAFEKVAYHWVSDANLTDFSNLHFLLSPSGAEGQVDTTLHFRQREEAELWSILQLISHPPPTSVGPGDLLIVTKMMQTLQNQSWDSQE